MPKIYFKSPCYIYITSCSIGVKNFKKAEFRVTLLNLIERAIIVLSYNQLTQRFLRLNPLTTLCGFSTVNRSPLPAYHNWAILGSQISHYPKNFMISEWKSLKMIRTRLFFLLTDLYAINPHAVGIWNFEWWTLIIPNWLLSRLFSASCITKNSGLKIKTWGMLGIFSNLLARNFTQKTGIYESLPTASGLILDLMEKF